MVKILIIWPAYIQYQLFVRTTIFSSPSMSMFYCIITLPLILTLHIDRLKTMLPYWIRYVLKFLFINDWPNKKYKEIGFHVLISSIFQLAVIVDCKSQILILLSFLKWKVRTLYWTSYYIYWNKSHMHKWIQLFTSMWNV